MLPETLQKTGIGCIVCGEIVLTINTVSTMMSIAESNVNHPSVADAMQSCEKNSSSKGDSAHSMRFLPDGFEPGEHDVLCGRGRKCFNHPGNVKFREIVQSFLAQYSKAMTKLEKSYILSDVVEKVRKNSGIGGFIKKNEDGRWYVADSCCSIGWW